MRLFERERNVNREFGVALWIEISPGSSQPIYLQIVDRISEAIAKEQVRPGDKLPPVRALAAELVINPNTVARAYGVLERAGLVTTKTGSGTFVTEPKLRSADAADLNALTEQIDKLITRGINMGLETRNLIAIFKVRVEKFVDKQKSERKK